jgi:hypothetical protein
MGDEKEVSWKTMWAFQAKVWDSKEFGSLWFKQKAKMGNDLVPEKNWNRWVRNAGRGQITKQFVGHGKESRCYSKWNEMLLKGFKEWNDMISPMQKGKGRMVLK